MSPSAPSSQIADVLARSLTSVFVSLCTERYGGPMSLHRVEGDSPSTVLVRLDRAGLPTLEASLAVRHAGGNVYDVEGRVESGPVQSFRYCLPDPAPLLVPTAPRLARDVAAFLLDALERRLGSNLLRQTVRDVSSTTAPPVTARSCRGRELRAA